MTSRNPFVCFALLLACALILAQTGCVGATGANTAPAATKSASTTDGSTPSISTPPARQTVTAGQSATFVVVASGQGPLTYIWSKNGLVVAGATSASYTTPATTMSDNGALFAVGVSNSMGNALSSPAPLNVTSAPVAPSIDAQPMNQTVTAGQTATFSATASGTAPLTYQWSKNGTPISGATAASYTTAGTTSADNAAIFTVAVSNSVSTTTSGPATLTVSPATTYVISAAPTSFTFAAAVNGTAPALQTAIFVSTPATYLPFTLSADQSWITMSASSGTTKATLQFGVNPAGLTAGTYTGHVVATPSGAGNPPLSVPVTLVLSPATAVAPAIVNQPISQTVPAGQTASFNVAATGTAPLSYQWSRNGAPISGAMAASYTTAGTTSADNAAIFTVAVSNSVSTTTSGPATLTVSPATTYVISAAPTSFTFAAAVNGTAPALQTVIFVSTPATYLPFTLSADQSWITMSASSGTTKATLQFGVNPAGLTAGTYTGHVVATPSGAGNPPLSVPVMLVVSPGTAVTPAIVNQPISQTVAAGQTASFNVAATGTAPLTYQWSKNGTPISGATAASYTTAGTTSADNAAIFTVAVSNSVSTTTSGPATLTVSPATTYVISAAPTSFTFAAAVNGTAPALQTAIFVSTPATYLPFTLSADQSWITMSASSGTTKATLQFGVNPAGLTAGTYTGHVVATPSGAGNPPLSVPVTLTVSAAPVPGTLTMGTNSLNFSSVNVGSNSTQPVTFTNSGATNITISNVSISGAGFNANGVSTGTILAAGQTATLNVTFAPSASGSATGTATIASNAANSPGTVSLTGSAVQPVQHSVFLTWTDTATIAGYNVYKATISGGLYTKLTSSLALSPSYTDSTVTAGQTYYYVVTAVDSNGNESVYSTPASASIPTP